MQTIPLTWGELIKHPAERLAGGDYPRHTTRHVYLPLEYFGLFLEVNEELTRLLGRDSVLPRFIRAPAYLVVFDPPAKKDLPKTVTIP